jgi:hypothetical protein
MLNREAAVLFSVVFVERLRTYAALIKKNRRDLLLIALWTIAIAVIFIRTHQQYYLDTPMVTYYQIGYSGYAAPKPLEIDLMLILLISSAVTVFLISIKSVIFGYFASLFLSSIMTVIYVFLFNWYSLGLGGTFVELPFGWEWVLFQAILNTFRYMFPLGITFSLIGVCVGSVLRVLTNRG